MQVEAVQLVATDSAENLFAEATHRLGELARTGSRWTDVVQMARVYQEMGNALAERLYGSLAGKIACACGCDSCCMLPSEARGISSGNFRMSILDAVVMIEEYEVIKQADGTLPARVLEATSEARRTKDLVRCPHLSAERGCRIYAHRPVACKIWFSTELGLCLQNRQAGYQTGLNPWTDASNQLRRKLEEPFVSAMAEVAPELSFDGHDFLLTLEEIAMLDERSLFGTLRSKVDAGELSTWDPFEAPEVSA